MRQVLVAAETALVMAMALVAGILVGMTAAATLVALAHPTEAAMRLALMAGPVMGAIAVLATARFESTRAHTGRGQS